MPTSGELLSSDEDPTVEDLFPETIEGVAARLLVSDTFEELVYRECELDALWTMADIAITMIALQETGHAAAAWRTVPEGSEANLVMLRNLIEEAHEYAARAKTQQAANVLHEAARLCASWS